MTSTQGTGLPFPSDVLIVEEPDIPSGNAWWSPAQRVVLVLPGLDPAERPRVLAHECAHILLGHGGDTEGDAIERAADAFGDFLLMCTGLADRVAVLEERVS